MSVLKRLGKGMGAYTYSQGVTIGIQLLGLPVFLSIWSLEQYGIWLILSAVPVYFSMSDLGVVAVAGNKMTMAMANNDTIQANRIFQSALLMTVCVLGLIMAVSTVILAFLDGGILANTEYKGVLFLLIVATLLGVLNNLMNVVFIANNQYATGTYLVSNARVVEWSCTIIAAYLFDDLIFAAAGYLFGRASITLFNLIFTMRRHRHFIWSFKYAEWESIKEMLKPSLAFMAMPVSQAISLQGMTLVVGAFLGPVSVVFFNSYRTLSRFLLQGAMVINKPLWPEFSRLFGLGKINELWKYFYRSLLATSLAMILGMAFLYFTSDVIFEYWTSGKVTIIDNVYYLMVLVACITGVGQVATIVISATNLHTQYFIIVLIASIISVATAYLTIDNYELQGVAIILLVSELLLLIISSIFVSKKILAGRA